MIDLVISLTMTSLKSLSKDELLEKLSEQVLTQALICETSFTDAKYETSKTCSLVKELQYQITEMRANLKSVDIKKCNELFLKIYSSILNWPQEEHLATHIHQILRGICMQIEKTFLPSSEELDKMLYGVGVGVGFVGGKLDMKYKPAPKPKPNLSQQNGECTFGAGCFETLISHINGIKHPDRIFDCIKCGTKQKHEWKHSNGIRISWHCSQCNNKFSPKKKFNPKKE